MIEPQMIMTGCSRCYITDNWLKTVAYRGVTHKWCQHCKSLYTVEGEFVDRVPVNDVTEFLISLVNIRGSG